ncbi:hypothetical protein [Pseudorhodoferax sp. Leaf274]|uniref:hypothetical protein n=1 Tax=Pseudorhodoferax sp. Leaf274 TaxID=1736318 RepID=UPI0012E28775|nr:hypothetical protein [Pseudorhodoferax sp. Leaf274]
MFGLVPLSFAVQLEPVTGVTVELYQDQRFEQRAKPETLPPGVSVTRAERVGNASRIVYQDREYWIKSHRMKEAAKVDIECSTVDPNTIISAGTRHANANCRQAASK